MKSYRRASFLALILASACGIFFTSYHFAAAASYTRLFYYRPSAAADQALFTHPNSIDILAPQTYALASDGTLMGSTSPVIRTFTTAHGIKIMPLVTNGSFQPSVYQAILNNPTAQNAAIAALVAEAKKQGYWGWQIDFEPMNAAYRDRFSAFVAAAAAALHKKGLELSIAVVAQTSDNPADYPGNFWQTTAGVFDYTALAKNADFLSIMSYDDPFSRGPIVEYPWLKKVLAYSVARVPAEKISLGIPLYYWQWNNRTGKRIGIGGAAAFTDLLKAHASGASFAYSAYEQEPLFRYQHYVVWYENTRSLARKISLIKSDGLYGFSAWRLGLETPAIFRIF